MDFSCDRFFVICVFCTILITGCQKEKATVVHEVYEGPLIAIDSVDTEMSDEGHIVVKLKAPRQLDLANGDTEWPEGLYLQYLNEEGVVTSTFIADYVYKESEKNIYRGEGNVVVRSLNNGDELHTEELFWDPNDEKFYTDRFVTIKSEDEVHTGEGLIANQDFTTYQIQKPSGTINLIEQ
ncbi:MAG: LPS export ABC transporter periplasmic protein LptC [Bacteroidota bacterium]